MYTRKQLNEFLQKLTEYLDIPESNFKKAADRYASIGNWLERETSSVADFNPRIFPQGSFSLGTVIRPVSDKEDYDIDLVCKLNLQKSEISQAKLKSLIGNELLGYVKSNGMKNDPEEKRRCWGLNYSDGVGFHLDVLPSIPDNHDKGHRSLAITDNKHPNYNKICLDWEGTNPEEYTEWFSQRMKSFRTLETFKASPSDIPPYSQKTPLQRVVQILKRHRDITYTGDPEDKPISIIITTLAGYAYQGETTIVDALEVIIGNIEQQIIDRGGELWVANPVNANENFADKWTEYPQRKQNFYSWIDNLKEDFTELVNSPDELLAIKSLERQYGEVAVNEATQNLRLPNHIINSSNYSTKVSTIRPLVVIDRNEVNKPWGDK